MHSSSAVRVICGPHPGRAATGAKAGSVEVRDAAPPVASTGTPPRRRHAKALARRTFATILAAASACLSEAASQAQERLLPPSPQIDLGLTSFLDGEGGVPAPPTLASGALVEVITNIHAATYAKDRNGHVAPAPSGQRSATAVLHPVYLSDSRLAGGHLGFEVLLPFSAVHVDASARTRAGRGDTTFAPFLQWGGLQLLDMTSAMRLGLQGVAPTGLYSPLYALNLGQHAWQVSPYLAFTTRVGERLEVSGRLIHDHSFANTAPPLAFAARSIQSGDLAVLDLSTSYDYGRGLRIGIAGYALQQLASSKRDGVSIPGSLARAWALGPGLLYYDGRTSLIANLYREFASRNRAEGASVVVRVLQPF